jgi:hypothetical protein
MDKEPDIQAIIDHYTGNVGLEVVPEEDSEPSPPAFFTEVLRELSTLRSYLESQWPSTINAMKHLVAWIGSSPSSAHLSARNPQLRSGLGPKRR